MSMGRGVIQRISEYEEPGMGKSVVGQNGKVGEEETAAEYDCAACNDRHQGVPYLRARGECGYWRQIV